MILRCISCLREFKPVKGLYYCPNCGNLYGVLEVLYDYEKISLKKEDFQKKASLFQFEKLLPVKNTIQMGKEIGGTPLLSFPDLLVKDLLIKYDGTNPSASYKDRASIIALNLALEQGYKEVFCASTGNAASSLAILSAPLPLKTYIFVPSSIPAGKRAQLEVSGAEVIAVDASYDEVFDLSLEIGLKKGWYCRNSAINPFLTEGKKTGALEIIVQNDFKVPDYVLVSVGDGTVISSICKGFQEFYDLGLTDKIPIVIGVQSKEVPAIENVYKNGEPFEPAVLTGNTVADSISVGNPRDVIKACKYVKKTNGYFVTIAESEIVEAIFELCKKTGVFAEPAGAITFAGLKKLVNSGQICKKSSVCLVVTGNGLKDVNAVLGRVSCASLKVDDVYFKYKID